MAPRVASEALKRSVVQFLVEALLIEAAPASEWDDAYAFTRSPPIIELKDADLDHTDLRGLSLGIASFRGARLTYANLTGTNIGGKMALAVVQPFDLGEADLSFAKLQQTTLQAVNMRAAKLKHADLTSIKMVNAVDLTDADLSGADLTNAELSGVNLTGAIVTENQLNTCKSIRAITMPNGSKYEDWLKDKEDRGEER